MVVAQLVTDSVIEQISKYAIDASPLAADALQTARVALLDTIGCALAALSYPACTKLLGPAIPGTIVPFGARVPGTTYVLDPVQGAFNFGACARWLDFNDTWLAAEWGHPSDNLAAILPLTDCLAQGGLEGMVPARRTPTMHDVLDALTRAYEIQGVLALTNSLNRHGFDHVLFVKVAASAVSARLLGADEKQVVSAVSNAIVDNAPLRTYRHAPNTGSRKSWAAADAASRGVQFALMAMKGEMGYPQALTAPTWGFQDVILGGESLTLNRPLQAFIMKNILFKVAYPAEFHAQTALEASMQLYPHMGHRWQEVDQIIIRTHESAIRIIDKRGPLRNPADRDHCIQYIVAVALLTGDLSGEDYEDERAADERIDWLRARTKVIEEPQYSADYLDMDKRSAASSVTVQFADGTQTDTVVVAYPLGHPVRRAEALPKLRDKFTANVGSVFGQNQALQLAKRLWDTTDWLDWPVNQFVEMFLPRPDTSGHQSKKARKSGVG